MKNTPEQEKLEKILQNNLRIARMNTRLQQKEVSKIIGASNNYVCRLEQGLRSVPAVVLYQLCNLYKVNMADMFDENYAQNNPMPEGSRIPKQRQKSMMLEEKPMKKMNIEL